ncbi:hypothetical protein [Kitasatospora sp. NPDC018619]|uniref:hypothetical protein n=1 Tax=unclassified Kitasatospora TaxID=2633591 RepID=UPI00379A8370
MEKLLKDVAVSLLSLAVLAVGRVADGARGLRAGSWPTERRKRALVGSPAARAARAAERERIRALVAALGAVEGVEHLLTQVLDQCVRPSSQGPDHPRGTLLVCRIHARAHFVVRGTSWGPCGGSTRRAWRGGGPTAGGRTRTGAWSTRCAGTAAAASTPTAGGWTPRACPAPAHG